jgi:transcriptional regulator with XRE-family HTH domain
MENIGNNIRKFRKKKGYSQGELARMVGVSQKAVSAYERNYRRPPSSLIPHVAESLDTTTDALYEGSAGNDAGQNLVNPELWKIVEKLGTLSRSELKDVSRMIEKHLINKRL